MVVGGRLEPLKRILIVEDDFDTRVVLRVLLRKDFEVTDAPDADIALKLLQKTKFDLHVFDKNLPGLNGIDLAREAKKLNADSRTLIITGFQSFASAQDATELGVLDYLLKPFTDLEALRQRIITAARTPVRKELDRGNRLVEVYENDPVVAQRICSALSELSLISRVHEKIEPRSVLARALIVSWELAGGANGIKRLRELNVPFVVMTVEPNFEVTVASLRAGACGCLPKNVGTAGDLARELRRVLKVDA